jgi:hypothetical protein
MNQTAPTGRNNRPLVMALWANAAMLALILLVLLSRSNAPSLLPAAFAQNQAPIAGGGGVFVMPTQLSATTWGCYLLDVDSQTLCIYQYWPGDKNLRLHAARSYKWDRKLENFNTDTPTPKQVKALLDQAQGGPGAPQNNNAAPNKDDK